jgi:hypothetical protein
VAGVLPGRAKGANLGCLLDVKRLTASSNFKVEVCRFIPGLPAQAAVASEAARTRCGYAILWSVAPGAAALAGWETSDVA